jgi:hypothetical protein
MGKAIEHRGQDNFDLQHQTQCIQCFGQQGCPTGYVLYPIHKWGMFLHKLGGDMYHFSHLGKL